MDEELHRFLHGIATIAYGVVIFLIFGMLTMATNDAYLATLLLATIGLAYLSSATAHSGVANSPTMTTVAVVCFFGSLGFGVLAFMRALYVIWSIF